MSTFTTADVIVDRVRSVCAGAPFNFTEARAWTSFELQPTTNIDAVFRIPPPHSGHVRGGFSYTEERTDQIQVWVARKTNNDYAAVRQVLIQDMHSLSAAIVRDGLENLPDYIVSDNGRGHSIAEEQAGNEYVTLRLSLPFSYMFQG